MDIDLYLKHAKRTGYCIMSEADFVILPFEMYEKLLKIEGVNEALNSYYKDKKNK